MSAAFHRVRHLPAIEAEPLFRDKAGKASKGVHLTVMLRADVFQAGASRRMINKAQPHDVFDRVNSILASKLALEPLELPTLAECIAAS